jgi:predicted nucleic acid-binding protein
MAFVADNSVIFAWFIESQADNSTRALLDRAALEVVHVPVVWPAEFANALLVLMHRRRLRPREIPEIVDAIGQLEIKADTATPSPATLIAVAQAHSLSAYDACYLELALRLELPIAARDDPLRKAAQRAGVLLV